MRNDIEKYCKYVNGFSLVPPTMLVNVKYYINSCSNEKCNNDKKLYLHSKECGYQFSVIFVAYKVTTRDCKAYHEVKSKILEELKYCTAIMFHQIKIKNRTISSETD